MFQMGPGEGFHAAKDKVLELEPLATCKLSNNGNVRHYRMYINDVDASCAAATSRDAWNRMLDRLERQFAESADPEGCTPEGP